ncbi:pyridoxal phosphate-dependent aminotransferase [Sphingomonas sp. OK281]|uniref:pyridoxal phosphate-dependent aminotransferase n=1 Tax=Sphingomonas sp. OK281 TaxID=1881067 RepID=UPI0008EB07BA|nr:aminotransferase class I/II-fold pyridoxal phosphate-dependent enzyme [Sphingomonas sp. OK281]SFO41973.1 Aspartate/methionine/tyrosine aminotransferase [Sphingomonas sp. OK281]
MNRPELPDLALSVAEAARIDGARPLGTDSYSQWVRKVIRTVRSERNLLVSLFDSSVPEPIELLRQFVAEGFSETITSRYTSAFANGNPYVVEQLARRYAVPADQVVCTTGATGALSLIYRALLKPGDRVLVENPGFDLFHKIAETYGFGVDRFERRGDDFAIDPDEVAAAMTPETRLIVLANLHNPSGMAIPPETLAAIGRIAEARGVHVIVDEVYGDYVDPVLRPPPGMQLSPALISVSSLTKSHGLSTLRCGWIVGAPAPIGRIRALAEEIDFGISNLSHAIAALVLERPQPFDDFRSGIMRRARPIVESYHAYWRDEGLVAGALPPFGCIAFPRLVGIDDTVGFSEWLADRCGVIVAPGEYFGAPGHIRIGFARAPADVDYGLQALTDGLIRYRDQQARDTR